MRYAENTKRPCRAHEKMLKLRSDLSSVRPIVAIGAHDAMSAHLIEIYGFDVVWASSFGISTMMYAIPDANLITMTEALSAAIRMDMATNLPVIADCDNGYGDLSNLIRTVKEYERAGIAGICVEDYAFPKRNSLYEGKTVRKLIPVKEQVRRIHSAKLAQETEDFLFIARTESLVAGFSVQEAIERASAYIHAGADAILVQSRDCTLNELRRVVEGCNSCKKVPWIVLTTLCPTISLSELHEIGFQMIILANQPMRAAIQAIENTLKVLKTDQKTVSVEASIAPIQHVFDLVNFQELVLLDDSQ
jgi:phosphoenolpyruvate phosphomutase